MEDLMDIYLGDEVDDVQQCCDDPFICKDIANYVCKNCGMCGDPVYTYFRNFNYYVKKKSIHSRSRWFSNMLVDYVRDYDDREVLTMTSKPSPGLMRSMTYLTVAILAFTVTM